MINWILQKNLTKPEILNRITAVLERENVLWEMIEVIPFSEELPEIQHKNAIPIIYGSTTFMLNAFRDTRYQTGVFYHPDTFQMQNYVKHWKENVLNYDGFLVPFGELSTIKSSPSKKWFLRPNHDGKEFSGQVLSFEELVSWSDKICSLNLPDFNKTTEIWLSEPKEILKEWRLFIVDNQIVSACRYAQYGELNESKNDLPNAMLDFAKTMINTYRLHDIYVMDIAEIKTGFKLIECNCFNGTGFYQHNIEAIISAINHFFKS